LLMPLSFALLSAMKGSERGESPPRRAQAWRPAASFASLRGAAKGSIHPERHWNQQKRADLFLSQYPMLALSIRVYVFI
jgi:hypothetical protein